MDLLKKQILSLLKESDKEVSVSRIANKLNKDSERIKFELRILADNNLIEVGYSTSGKIKRAMIKPEGEKHFKEATTIITKESVQEEINELKNKISSLEEALKQAQENPTEENKQTLLEKADTIQSVANGVFSLVKAGVEFFK